MKAQGELRYSCTFSLTSALDRSGWLTPCPGRFIPRSDPVPHGGPKGRTGRLRKISPSPGLESLTFQPVASHTYRYDVFKNINQWPFLHVSHTEGIGQIGDQKWRRDRRILREELQCLNYPSNIIDRVFFLPSLVRTFLLTHCRCRGSLLHLIILCDTHTHTHTQSVGLLWTGDRFFAATSTWDHTTPTTDIHAHCGIRTCSPSKQTKSHSFDRAANGVGLDWVLIVLITVL
jgi:hypothetical protein